MPDIEALQTVLLDPDYESDNLYIKMICTYDCTADSSIMQTTNSGCNELTFDELPLAFMEVAV